jgi:uncharacterized DUF497 family protein
MHDPEHPDREDRVLLLGMSRKPGLLLASHCYRESEEQIRIISAKKTAKNENEQYWGYGYAERI